ncbi:hypothetical protein HGRIS_012755 [Hohenbuehelia grisea]|uniref:AB hydrolase-1 domain-containing protein n=1 Tax=Hohenbuehelia grisea TaxID=104357 RepID=A0ABR3IT86_9AGAR
MASFDFLALPDGAKIAYEVLGANLLGHRTPVILVCGMAQLRGDWERLSTELAQRRPVLVYDHRGIGNSKYSSEFQDDSITIESLARDLLCLLTHLGWEQVSICGFSMGGVVAQRLLLLPFPRGIPFRVTRLFLAATRCAVLEDERLGVGYSAPPSGITRTPEERLEVAKSILRSTFDRDWLQGNPERFQVLLRRSVANSQARPPKTLLKQKAALSSFDFVDLLPKLPRETDIVLIHGNLDQVIPLKFGQAILGHVPWARMVEVGSAIGQVPSLEFGHHWFEYFDVQVWVGVLDAD